MRYLLAALLLHGATLEATTPGVSPTATPAATPALEPGELVGSYIAGTGPGPVRWEPPCWSGERYWGLGRRGSRYTLNLQFLPKQAGGAAPALVCSESEKATGRLTGSALHLEGSHDVTCWKGIPQAEAEPPPPTHEQVVFELRYDRKARTLTGTRNGQGFSLVEAERVEKDCGPQHYDIP